MKKLFDEFPFRSARKFVPLAIKNGFTKSAALQFLESLTHDKKFDRQTEMMLPIFGRKHGCYQMDTLVQTSKASPRYFLILVNINSRKLFAIPMNTKDASSVLTALKSFISEAKEVQAITSDQDKAYLSPEITRFMINNHIDHQTTLENDHNRLGIINRAIKKLERRKTNETLTSRASILAQKQPFSTRD